MAYQVASETGRLEQVILHRPGRELDRLTPTNKEELLFDDLLWLDRAQAEHDAFAQVLREAGAEVRYVGDLLAETLALPRARGEVLDRIFDERIYGPEGVTALRGYAEALSDPALAEFLIAGMTKRELLEQMNEPTSMDIRFMGIDDFVLHPLPNHLFTRDASCWVYDGVAINSMSKPARRGETTAYEAIYRWHPSFADAGFQVWGEGAAEGRSTVEGGDVLVIGNGAVLVGLSERTAAIGAERLARRLFDAGSAQVVVCVELEKARAQMHLDTVLTMLDPESFVRYPLFGDRRTWTLRPGTAGTIRIAAHAPDEFGAVLAAALGLPAVRILTPPYDGIAAQREQWNDGCNVLAVAPGVVVGYDRNAHTSDFLRANGIEVLDVPGSELGRGRGGPRCMSCPTRRADL